VNTPGKPTSESDELARLQALWQAPTPEVKPVDVSALLDHVQRKQRGLRWKHFGEWLLFFGSVAMLVWALAKPMTPPMKFFVAFNIIVLPWFQWHLVRKRRAAALSTTLASDAKTLLRHARKQSQSELSIAELYIRTCVWLSIAGVVMIPWFWVAQPAPYPHWKIILLAYWYLTLLLIFTLYRRRARKERERLAWIDAQDQQD
jgi:Flp pilus assembly protein TadB